MKESYPICKFFCFLGCLLDRGHIKSLSGFAIDNLKFDNTSKVMTEYFFKMFYAIFSMSGFFFCFRIIDQFHF